MEPPPPKEPPPPPPDENPPPPDELKNNGHIHKRVNKEECKKKNVMDDMIYEDSVKLYGLKKYLLEFSNMKTKEAMEVMLWDEYLMFAYLFGIADKVAKQLKDMYPDVVLEMQKQKEQAL